MNDQDIARAVNDISRIYRDRHWAWGTGVGSHIPSDAELALTARSLLAQITSDPEVTEWATGRLRAIRDGGAISLCLDLAEFSDEPYGGAA